MSLERKDVRFKLHADKHHFLTLLAQLDDKEIAVFVEKLIEAEIERRIHQATVLASCANEVGLLRKHGD